MNGSDKIREYCIEQYIKPARLKGEKGVFLCVGDIHRSLGLSDRLPQVCSALGSNTFEEEASVKRVHIEGPLNGSSTLFVYLLI